MITRLSSLKDFNNNTLSLSLSVPTAIHYTVFIDVIILIHILELVTTSIMENHNFLTISGPFSYLLCQDWLDRVNLLIVFLSIFPSNKNRSILTSFHACWPPHIHWSRPMGLRQPDTDRPITVDPVDDRLVCKEYNIPNKIKYVCIAMF